MKKKIKFYKSLLVELIETICTICLVLLKIASRNHITQGEILYDHFSKLKDYSIELRQQLKSQDSEK